jgi:hypothetical protein
MKKKSLLGSSILFLMLMAGCTTHIQQMPGTTYSLSDMVQTIPVENMLIDSTWNIWCGSMVRGYDKKYHLFFSRWPRCSGHESWVSHSEIAYAVSKRPEGPYHFVNVTLPAYSDSTWDGAMTHNPYVIMKDKKYYLYYIATRGHIMAKNEKFVPYSNEWWIRRNTQRIGVAVASKPEGPWTRMKEPVLNVSTNEKDFDALCVTNPAICIGRHGVIVMLYKAVCKDNTIRGGKVRLSVAFADNPLGPFKKTGQLIFEPKDDRMLAEDPFLWYDSKQDKYFAIVRDVVRKFTGEDSGGLALFESPDAIHWVPAKYPKVLPEKLRWSDGSEYNAKENHVERPWLYFDKKGFPRLLFGAFSIHTNHIYREHCFNGCIPLRKP